LENSCCAPALPLAQTTALHYGQNHAVILLPRWAPVEEEADETIYWMQMLIQTGLVQQSRLSELLDEAHQIVAIIAASIKTARVGSSHPKSGFRSPK
jgi:hypothetical protein